VIICRLEKDGSTVGSGCFLIFLFYFGRTIPTKFEDCFGSDILQIPSARDVLKICDLMHQGGALLLGFEQQKLFEI
jgi:hypothetical protein